jgi:DNA-binding MarR family transcriptional regulator
VSRIIARAHDRGLLTIAQLDRDRRQKVIELSPLGRSRLAEAFPLWKKAQRIIESMFDPDALQTLVGRLRKGSGVAMARGSRTSSNRGGDSHLGVSKRRRRSAR